MLTTIAIVLLAWHAGPALLFLWFALFDNE